ncbi:MAG: S8 family serine peptidase [Sulfuricurvum sp.]|nr:S8 family serine peptidase [Sulfuricurvum sp.]
MNKRPLSYLSAGFVVIMCGCGGGAGGPTVPSQSNTGTQDTNTTDTNTTTPPVVTPPVVTPPVETGPIAGVDYTNPAQFWQTAPLTATTKTNMSQIYQSNVNVAHDNGYTGGDLSKTLTYTTVASDTGNRNLQTIIGIIDSGINANAGEFNSTNKIVAWKDFSPTASSTPYEKTYHGTFVSYLAAGNRDSAQDAFYGVAYGAQLAVANGMENGKMWYSPEALNWMAELKNTLDTNSSRLVAVNMSYGGYNSPNLTEMNAMKNVLNAGITLTVGAGNNGYDCLSAATCSDQAYAPWYDANSTASFLNASGGFIVAGSVDADNNISSFSNRAGLTKSNYLVTKAENLYFPDMGAGYVSVSGGTSYSAPQVAGAIALLTQKWPHLKGSEHAQILFDTATDLGEAGVDDIYGHGLMNLEKAFNPIGNLVIPAKTVSAQNVNTPSASVVATAQSASASSVRTSSALVSFATSALLSNTIAIDSYKRDFKVDMASAAGTTGTAPVDFDSFFSFRQGNLLIGQDTSRNLPMLGYVLGDTTLRASFDGSSMFGTTGTGALGIGSGKSAYLNARKTFALNNEITLGVEGTYGYGTAGHADNSLIGATSAHALGGKAEIAYNGFGVGYKIPLRTVSGEASITAPTGIDTNGNVVYNSETISLKPSSFQQTVSMFYRYGSRYTNLLAELSRTNDAYGVQGVDSSDAKVLLSRWF